MVLLFRTVMRIYFDDKRTLLIFASSVSVVCCATAAVFIWFKNNKNKNCRKCSEVITAKNNNIDCSDNVAMIEIMEPCHNIRMNTSNASPATSTQTILSPPIARGGRKNYRAMKKRMIAATSNDSAVGHQNFSSASPESSSSDAEARAERLAAEFSARMTLPHAIADQPGTSTCVPPTGSHVQPEPESISSAYDSFTNVKILAKACQQQPHLIMDEQQSASPSLTLIDGRSEEGSQDSGKGASVAQTSSVSPADDLIETPLIYEFEIPQSIVGLVIGRQGITIKQFTDRSGAQMIIRRHYAGDNFKICTVEGHREQINNCLRLIRRKFPPSRFPELKLTPIMPPPIICPMSPIIESVARLNLPDAIKCEVVVSSLMEPGHFFVQQPTHPSFMALSRLDQYMLAVYNQHNGVPNLPRPIEEGVICAAPVMDGWFRAQTIEVYDETDEVLVKFVDYGGYLRIAASELRQIRSDFMSLPFQAIECTLAHVKPIHKDDGWSPESLSFFERTVYGKMVDAVVVGRNPDDSLCVELHYNSADEETMEASAVKSTTINQALVDNGFAKWMRNS